jgi:hypothetical protein
MADEVAAGGEITAALSSDEFRRGMELAGIAGQVQVAADLLGSVGQPTLAAFLGRTSHQLRGLAVGAIGRATEGAVVAHGAQHLASRLAALGLSEMHEGRDEYASSAALGAASAEMAAGAVRSAAAGAAELAAATAMGGLAETLATDGADHPAEAGGADLGAPGSAAAATSSIAECRRLTQLFGGGWRRCPPGPRAVTAGQPTLTNRADASPHGCHTINADGGGWRQPLPGRGACRAPTRRGT